MKEKRETCYTICLYSYIQTGQHQGRNGSKTSSFLEQDHRYWVPSVCLVWGWVLSMLGNEMSLFHSARWTLNFGCEDNYRVCVCGGERQRSASRIITQEGCPSQIFEIVSLTGLERFTRLGCWPLSSRESCHCLPYLPHSRFLFCFPCGGWGLVSGPHTNFLMTEPSSQPWMTLNKTY